MVEVYVRTSPCPDIATLGAALRVVRLLAKTGIYQGNGTDVEKWSGVWGGYR